MPDPGSRLAQFVIVRHGESQANRDDTFAGWRDSELTDRGRAQAVAAGERLAQAGYRFDVVFTSMLQRAVHTADLLLAALGQTNVDRQARWRLNERHVGAMQGKTRQAVKVLYGRELARTYRAAWDRAPPAAEIGGVDDPRTDARYADSDGDLPLTEAIGDLDARVRPVWAREMAPRLAAGQSVLVVAHGMSLRALVRPVEGITGPELPGKVLASAVPRCYFLGDDLCAVNTTELGDTAGAPDE